MLKVVVWGDEKFVGGVDRGGGVGMDGWVYGGVGGWERACGGGGPMDSTVGKWVANVVVMLGEVCGMRGLCDMEVDVGGVKCRILRASWVRTFRRKILHAAKLAPPPPPLGARSASSSPVAAQRGRGRKAMPGVMNGSFPYFTVGSVWSESRRRFMSRCDGKKEARKCVMGIDRLGVSI